MNDIIELQESIPEETRLTNLESKIEIRFQSHEQCCLICGNTLWVLKTQKTTVKSIRYGEFYAIETILVCIAHKYEGNNIRKYDSTELNQLVPPYSNFAYDVISYVGISRFLHNKQKSEIQQELKIEYGLTISDGGITHLSDKFLIYVRCIHEMAST